jgi:hypothetical protein
MRIRNPDLKACLCQDGERSRRRSRLSSVCEEGWGDSPLYESLEEIHVLGNASKIQKLSEQSAKKCLFIMKYRIFLGLFVSETVAPGFGTGFDGDFNLKRSPLAFLTLERTVRFGAYVPFVDTLYNKLVSYALSYFYRTFCE